VRRPGPDEFGLRTATTWASWLLITAFLQFHSYCRREPALLRRRPDKVPFVASNIGKYSHLAVGFGARRGEEVHARRCHPRIRGVEVLNLEKETHPPGSLLPDGGGLVLSVSPREQQAGRRPRRPDHYPPLGAPIVRQAGQSSASSKPSPSTKKLIAGSYSLTTTVMRPRCTAPA
jgi:hypothetical protein